MGLVAKRQTAVNPEDTFHSVKLFDGRQAPEVTEELKVVAYIGETAGAKLQVSAQVLRKLSTDAGMYLTAKVNEAVVTVPAYFNDSQRQATKDVGKIASLEVLRIVNEPTPAPLVQGLEKKDNETILVCDLGGGAVDVSMQEVGGGVSEVLSTNGDTHLCGDDFVKKIVD